MLGIKRKTIPEKQEAKVGEDQAMARTIIKSIRGLYDPVPCNPHNNPVKVLSFLLSRM